MVSHEDYEAANATIRKGKYHKAAKTDRADAVYYCGHCGRRLRKTFGLDEYFSCATQMYKKDAPCVSIRWSRTEIERVVLAAYKAHLAVLGELFKQQADAPTKNPLQECRTAQKAVSVKLDGMDRKNLALYEQYRAGSFNKDAFLEKKSRLLKRKEYLQQEMVRLRAEEERLIQSQKAEEEERQAQKEAVDSLSKPDELLKQQMYSAIERVEVFGNEELKIEWKFDHISALKG